MQKKTKVFLLVFFLFATLALISCHTGRHLSPGKAYQNLTAYYNTYFNAREIYNLALKKIDLANPDQYDRLLAFYKLGDEASAAGLATEMDQVIKKCSAVILRHEKSDWVARSYLLMGKAFYIKGDYTQALENFQFVYNTYTSDTVKVTALLWAARAYMQQNRPAESEQALEIAFSAGPVAIKKNCDELYTTAARFYLNAKDTARCVKMIEQGFLLSRNNALKARYCFILAQLNFYEGKQEASDQWFIKVLRYSPGFNLEFGARLGLAQSGGGTNAVKASLQRLLKDEKSLEFVDQIYYALARVSQHDHHLKEALGFYQKSLASNTTNTNQRGLDYLRMGEIYLSGFKNYPKASAYQDSALFVLDKDYPEYDMQKIKQQKLSALIANFRIIEQGDTLLLLAALDSNARKQKVRSIVEAEFAGRKAAEKAAIEAYKKQLLAASSQFSNQNSASSQIGSALNRPQVASNSLLSTTGSYSASSMSSYQPSASNQMQIYAQGASSSGSGQQGGQAGGGYSSTSSGGGFGVGGSFGGSGSAAGGASGSGGGYSGATGGGTGFGASAGTGPGGTGNSAVPVYGATAPVYNQQQTASLPVASQPSGGAGLYGGVSYNTVGQGAGSVNPTKQTSLSGSTQTGSMPAPDQANGNTGFSSSGASGTPFNTSSTTTPTGNSTGSNTANPSASSQGTANYPAGSQNYNPGAYLTGQQAQMNFGSNGNSAGSSFYFANPQAMTQGFMAFRERWGNRPLRDNWRRTNRGAELSETVGTPEATVAVQKSPQTIALETLKDDPAPAIKLLLSLVPGTPEAKDSLLGSILLAYGSNAAIYEADLYDPAMAIATYQEAIKRFKNDPRMASFNYQLYSIYTKLGASEKAQAQRSVIIHDFPKSVYAISFTNPQELEPKPTRDSVLENYYQASYDAYTKHDYASVIERSKHIPTVELGNYLIDKFELLRVLSVGNTKKLQEFEPQLIALSASYPGSPVGAQAATLLKQLDSNRAVYSVRNPVLQTPLGENGFVLAERENDRKERVAARLAEALKNERKRFFSNDLKGPFYFIILYTAPKLNLRPLRFNLSQMALANFPSLHLQNAMIEAAGGRTAMEIGSFKDLTSALTYYRKFDQMQSDLLMLAPSAYEYFPISEENLKKLTGKEPLQIYREFFQDEILPYLLGQRTGIDPATMSKTSLPGKARALAAKKTIFDPATTGAWLLAVVVKNMHTGLNPTRLQISLFNQSNFAALNLHHESKTIGSEENEAQMISVNTFTTKTEADAYRKKFMGSIGEIVPLPAAEIEIILVSKANYDRLQDLQQLQDYKVFYKKQFPEKDH